MPSWFSCGDLANVRTIYRRRLYFAHRCDSRNSSIRTRYRCEAYGQQWVRKCTSTHKATSDLILPEISLRSRSAHDRRRISCTCPYLLLGGYGRTKGGRRRNTGVLEETRLGTREIETSESHSLSPVAMKPVTIRKSQGLSHYPCRLLLKEEENDLVSGSPERHGGNFSGELWRGICCRRSRWTYKETSSHFCGSTDLSFLPHLSTARVY